MQMTRRRASPDFAETKQHVLAAGQELLLAAHGALSFCRDYVEKSSKERRNPELCAFFRRALSVVEELTHGFTREHHGRKKTKNR